MASLTEIRGGIADALSTLDAQVLPYFTSNYQSPSVQVGIGEIVYDETGSRGMDSATFIVRVLVGGNISQPAQENLDAFRAPSGATSIKALLESDSTLGGLVDDLRVVGVSADKLISLSGTDGNLQPPALGADWTVQVFTEGTV